MNGEVFTKRPCRRPLPQPSLLLHPLPHPCVSLLILPRSPGSLLASVSRARAVSMNAECRSSICSAIPHQGKRVAFIFSRRRSRDALPTKQIKYGDKLALSVFSVMRNVLAISKINRKRAFAVSRWLVFRSSSRKTPARRMAKDRLVLHARLAYAPSVAFIC